MRLAAVIIAAAVFEASFYALELFAGAASAAALHQTLSPLAGGAAVAWAILPNAAPEAADHAARA